MREDALRMIARKSRAGWNAGVLQTPSNIFKARRTSLARTEIERGYSGAQVWREVIGVNVQIRRSSRNHVKIEPSPRGTKIYAPSMVPRT
jgi:hypothetical protein